MNTKKILLISFFCALAFVTAAAAKPSQLQIGFPLQVALGVRERVELKFETEAGKIYQVEVSPDLKRWVPDGYAIAGSGAPVTVLSSTWGLPRLFFRVRDDGDPNRLAPGGIPGPEGPQGPQGERGVGTAISVHDFGSSGEARLVGPVSILAASNLLTGTGFTPADVGRLVRIPGAGPAGGELTTTIEEVISTSSVRLRDAAEGAVSLTGVFVGVNDTFAVQAAFNAAEISSETRTVFFPPGVYMGNWTVPAGVNVVGAGGGHTPNFSIPNAERLQDRKLAPTVLVPASTAEPVLRVAVQTYGCVFRDFAVIGSRELAGYGIQIGNPLPEAVGYVGSNVEITRVRVSGFEYGLAVARAADYLVNLCTFTENRYCVYMGERDDSPGPLDTSVFNACVTGGPMAEYCFYAVIARGIVINGGDHNLAKHLISLKRGSTVVMTSFNSEGIGDEPIQIHAGRLVIHAASITSTSKPLVSVYGPTVAVDIGPLDLAGARDTALLNGAHVVYRTTGYEYPLRLPTGTNISRYTSTSWDQLINSESTTPYYESRQNDFRMPRISEEFVSGYTDPYGSLGWKLTTLGGVPGVGRSASPGSGFGRLQIESGSASAANKYRFGLEVPVQTATTLYWENRFTFSVLNSASAIVRAGQYSMDSAASLSPRHGVGVVVDRSAGHANIQFEVINNGVASLIDTEIPAVTLQTDHEYVITRNAQGLSLTIYKSHYITPQAVVQVFNSAALPSGVPLSPAFYFGSTNNSTQSLFLERFELRRMPKW